MFSVDDLFTLCADQDVIHALLRDLGFEDTRPRVCPKCGAKLDATVVIHQGKEHWRCKAVACRRFVPLQSGNLGYSKLPPHKIVQILYFWARDTHKLDELLGLDPKTVADWSARLRLCVANGLDSENLQVGGPGHVVEVDETEIGRRQKGIHGHKTSVKGDIWGCVDRSTGVLILEVYDKVKVGELWERRFGPPRADELTTLCEQFIQQKSRLYSDGARAYVQIAAKLQCKHAFVDHSSGEYVRGDVHTNTIDGWWGRLKVWWNARGGVQEGHIWTTLKEFQWRSNLRETDPWLSLLDYIRAGHFPS